MTQIRTLAPALAAALALSLGGAAFSFAQDAGGAPPPAPSADGQHHRQWDPEARKKHWEERRAERAKTMHDALSIRPDQEAAFQTFMASMTPMGGHHGGHGGMHGPKGDHDGDRGGDRGGDHGANLTTPERLDRAEKRMGERQAAFDRHAQAVKAFYAVLSPEQQRTFDALMKMHHHGGGRHGWGHDGGGQGGGMDREG
jgi:hypothetical protein